MGSTQWNLGTCQKPIIYMTIPQVGVPKWNNLSMLTHQNYGLSALLLPVLTGHCWLAGNTPYTKHTHTGFHTHWRWGVWSQSLVYLCAFFLCICPSLPKRFRPQRAKVSQTWGDYHVGIMEKTPTEKGAWELTRCNSNDIRLLKGRTFWEGWCDPKCRAEFH